jgi:hypothetical protein
VVAKVFDDTREKKAEGNAVFLLKIPVFLWLTWWLLFLLKDGGLLLIGALRCRNDGGLEQQMI